jgi:hypothetical protein
MNRFKLFTLALALPLLINCGGDEDSSANVIEEPPALIPTENTGKTTLLKDNPHSQGSPVKVFDNYSINIDMTEINMQGEYLFLKIIDKHKKALFLGQIVLHDNIKVPLTIVVDSFPLVVELYSESKEDKTISYEVYYD